MTTTSRAHSLTSVSLPSKSSTSPPTTSPAHSLLLSPSSPSPPSPTTPLSVDPPFSSSCNSSETNPVKPGNSSKLTSDVPGQKMSTWWVIPPFIVGGVLVLAVVVAFLIWWRGNEGNQTTGATRSNGGLELTGNPSSGTGEEGSPSSGESVVLDEQWGIDEANLFSAPRVTLWEGVYGTTCKAEWDGGVVVVKELKEHQTNVNFEQLMKVLGKVTHTNVVPPKAYKCAPDMKVVFYNYLGRGSLFRLLHEKDADTVLDWTTRLNIAEGAARGVAFIHDPCRELKLIHGNIKSTNILIDEGDNACVIDFGLSRFTPTSTDRRLNGYCSPESLDDCQLKLNQKSDVYSFGVLLLELLTGKCPSPIKGKGLYGIVGAGGVVDLPRWIRSVPREEWASQVFDQELKVNKDIEGEMVGLLHIAMACTLASPGQRPRMSKVVKSIEVIRQKEKVSR